jgi:hypothetical protein
LDEKSKEMIGMKIKLSVLFFLVSIVAYAHVGSPGVIYQGKAGPYTVMVNVTPPDVIPGTANVSVYIEGQDVRHVYLQPVYWYAGENGSPKEDEALRVKGIPGQYQGLVWLMQSGVASMRVTVEGASGKGAAIIPVMAVSTAQRAMPASLDWILAGLGVLLIVLMVTIIGASVTDGLIAPGGNDRIINRKKFTAMGVTAIVLVALLYGGSLWWTSWSSNYRRLMYKPPLAHSHLLRYNGHTVLHFNIDSAWLRKNNQSMSFVVPDHGKLMHLFLIREKTLDVFAHLHPFRTDSINYFADLPDLPAGRYLLFGDLVRWTGFSETISDTLTIPEKPIIQTVANLQTEWFNDPYDAWLFSNSVNDNKNPFTGKAALICGRPGTAVKLGDGSSVYWHHTSGTPFEANKVYPITFSLTDPSGQPAVLQPYMGMMGHAVVLKYDGSIYVHLHPVGTYSMASQEIIQSRMKGGLKSAQLPNPVLFQDSINRLVARIRNMSEDERNAYLSAGMKDMDMPGSSMNMQGAMVTFPYAFPTPGNYRIWVQLKRDGKILTSAFDAVVQ